MATITKPPLLDSTGQEMSKNLKDIANSLSNGSALDQRINTQITSDNITLKFYEWWGLADDGTQTKTELLERWFNLLKDEKIYGVKTYNFDDSVSSVGELTDDSVELGVCTPSTETTKGTDNFVKERAFWCVEVNYEIDSNGEIVINAVDGIHDTFSRRGNGMVGVAQKSAYIYESNDGTYNILKYSIKKHGGFKLLPECVSTSNTKRAFMVHAKYLAGVGDDGKLTSESGLAPCNYTYSHNSEISLWRARGDNYSGISMCDLKFREFMFRLKHAKKGNSGTMEGCTSYNCSYRPAVAEENVKRIILTTTQANNLVVGSWVSVGTAERNNANVLKAVKIKGIKVVTINSTSYSAIYLDTNTTISPTTDWYISTIPYGSGACDNVQGVDGSINNTNGKYPFIVQGLECQTGCWLVVADTIASGVYADNVVTVTPKMVRLARNISTGVTDNYYDCDSVEHAGEWQYIQDFAQDNECLLPRKVGTANSGNGCKCGMYAPKSSFTNEWLAWGNLANGGGCGLGCSLVNAWLGNAIWYFCVGAPGSGANRGELS